MGGGVRCRRGCTMEENAGCSSPLWGCLPFLVLIAVAVGICIMLLYGLEP